MRPLSAAALAAILAAFACLAPSAGAQTSYSGTVESFDRQALVVGANPFDLPIRYSASARLTTYVDENGNPVSPDQVRKGVPVTVYFDENGDALTATRVVVRTHP